MQPITLAQLADAFVGFPRSQPLGASALARLSYWRESLGNRAVIEISADEVDIALMNLQARGRLRPRRGGAAEATGTPLKGSTVNRYISTLGELYKHARRLRLIPRAHPSPLAGLERAPEPVDPNRYLRPEEIERLIRAARVVDRRWGMLPALIRMAFVTGLRKGNLQALRWQDVDFKARTASIPKTKNGDAHITPLTEGLVEELKPFARQASPHDLVFAGRFGRAHGFRRLWIRACNEAGLAGRNFHQVRHGTASAMATANISQAGIMAHLAHKTLSASRRYMHHNVEDRRAVVAKVFGA
jgi:integrase